VESTSQRSFLLSILVIYLAVASAYSFLVPLWEAPDEPSHFLCIRHIADTGRPPERPSLTPNAFDPWYGEELILSTYEWYQPPLYYLAASLPVRVLDEMGYRYEADDFPTINPYFPVQRRLFWPPEPSVAGGRTAEWEPRLLRLISVAFGAATLIALGRATRLAFPERPWLIPAVVGFVAFNPQFTFTMASISNDPLAILVSTVVFMFLIQILVSKGVPVIRLWILVALMLGVALLTKMTALFLLPAAMIVGVTRLFRSLPRRQAFLCTLLLVTFALALAAGCYFLLPGHAGIVARNVARRMTHIRWDLLDPPAQYFYEVMVQTNKTFWAKFGWGGIEAPMEVTRSLGIIAGLGLLSSAIQCFRAEDRDRRILLAFMLAASAVAFAAYFKNNLATYKPHSRMLMPALGPIAMLIVFGLLGPAPRVWGTRLGRLLPGAMLILNLSVLCLAIVPGYDNPIARDYSLDAHQGYSRELDGNVGGLSRPGQTFRVENANLARIDVFLVSHPQSRPQPILLRLREGSPSGPEVASVDILKEPASEARYDAFAFPAIPGSRGKTFFFQLESEDWPVEDGAEIWFHPRDRYPNGERYEGQNPAQGDLRFVALSLRKPKADPRDQLDSSGDTGS